MRCFLFIFFLSFTSFSQNTIGLDEVIIEKKITPLQLIKKILRKAENNYLKNDSLFLKGIHYAMQDKDTVLFFKGNAKVMLPNYINLREVLYDKIFCSTDETVAKYNKKIIEEIWFPKDKGTPIEECVPWHFPFYMSRSIEMIALKNIPCFDRPQDFEFNIEWYDSKIHLEFEEKKKKTPFKGVIQLNSVDYAVTKIKYESFETYNYKKAKRYYDIKRNQVEVNFIKNSAGKYELLNLSSRMLFSGYGNDSKVIKQFISSSEFEKGYRNSKYDLLSHYF